MASGKLTIKRTDQNINKFRKIQVYMDGSLLGEVESNETRDFEVGEGTHKLYAKIDWCQTPDVVIHISAGEAVEMELGSPLSANTVRKFAPVVLLLLLVAGNYAGKQLNSETILWFTFGLILAGMIYMFSSASTKPVLYYVLFARSKYIYLRQV